MSDQETPEMAEPAVDAAGKKPKTGNKKAVKRLTKQRRNLVVALLAEAAVIAGLLAWVIVQYLDSSDQHHLNSLRTSAASTAQEYALDFSTYDYQHLDQDFQTVTSHLAPSFRDSYTKTVASLKAIVVQYKGSATATIQGVGVTSVNTKTAVVLVFLDQKVTNTNLKAPRIDTNRLQITLERTNGSWLMSDLQLK